MGVGRARHGAMGLAAVKPGRLWLLGCLVAPLLLGGCSSTGEIVGVLTGAAAGGATANPAIGFGVAVATAAASDYAVKIMAKSWHGDEQDAIAATAAPLPVGASAPWRIGHFVPIGDEHGELQVIRQIENPLAPCKQVLFSVVAGKKPPGWYSVDICQDTQGWKWASAEPAVARWGYLQ